MYFSSWRFLCVNSLTIFVYLFLSPFLSVIHITEFNMLEFVGWFSGLCTIYLFSSLFIQSWETYSILSFISSTDFLNPFSYTLVIYFPMVPLFKYYPLLIQLGWYILIFLKTIIKSLENFLCFLHFLSPYYPSFSGMFVLPFVFHVERFPKMSSVFSCPVIFSSESTKSQLEDSWVGLVTSECFHGGPEAGI